LVSLGAWRAEARAVCGQFEEAIGSATEALRVADEIDHSSSRAIANAFLGYVLLMRGDLEAAVLPLSAGLALAEASGTSHAIIRNAAALASALCLLGRPEEGVRHLDRAVQVRDSADTTLETTRFGTLTATACLAAGRLAEARAEVNRGIAHVDAGNVVGHRPQLLRLRSEILARSGAYAEAISCGDEGRGLASEMGMRPEVAHGHLTLGRVFGLAGDRAEARRHSEIAAAMFEETGMRFWRIQAEAASRL
jgi:tetratricopeptide (TPR) repeat protein